MNNEPITYENDIRNKTLAGGSVCPIKSTHQEVSILT